MIFKNGLKLFGLSIVANVMCFILIISFSVLSTALFTDKIGYTMYGTVTEGEEIKQLYTYYYEDGDDTQKEIYKDKGYNLTEFSIRSVVPKGTRIFWHIVSQVFCFIIMFTFIYNILAKQGNKDSNLVNYKSQKEDKLKGLKIGLIAVAPSFVMLLYAAISKKVTIAMFAFLNSYLYDLISIICGGAKSFAELQIWQTLLLFILLVIIPLVSWGSYLLGYKSISISEKIIYKNKKEV